jgi:hypothetical protein
MSFGLLNALMLLGLAALAIPPLIHLLSRRRYQVVDWGAMQFLRVSETTRRRLFLEELLLMALRMGLLAVLVLAMAAPVAFSPLFARFGARENRDVVLVFDGSTSMGYAGSGEAVHEAAKKWAKAFVDRLAPGDSVAILQARQQVLPVLAEPTHDLERVRDALEQLPPPRGSCNWPEAVQAAAEILQQSQRPVREIILLGDGHRAGWADEAGVRRWQLLAPQLSGGRKPPEAAPRLWYVNLDPKRPDNPPNWSLARLRRGSRAVITVGREATFRTAIQLRGDGASQPAHRFRLLVDGQPVPAFQPQTEGGPQNGQLALSFEHRFLTAGSHLLSVEVEPDPPPPDRPAGYPVKDYLPADNRRDFAVEVLPPLPVLLVEGPPSLPNLPGSTGSRTLGTRALLAALAPARDPHPAVRATVQPLGQFDPARDLAGKNRPRVLILANVPELTAAQQEGVGKFLEKGGGVLVTLGDRVNARHYNDELHRGGSGWLPARLDARQEAEAAGRRDAGPTGDDTAAHPLPASFHHPALELLRGADALSGMGRVRFLRWWKLALPAAPDQSAAPGSGAVAVASLANNDPLLVERPFGKGRVLLCAVPLDDSWSPNLLSQWEYPLLAHELVSYLAGARSGEFNLLPGQPLQYQPPEDEPTGSVMLQPPHGPAKTLPVERWPLLYHDTREPGVYRLTLPSGRLVYFVVEPDPGESELAPSKEEERRRVAAIIPVQYQERAEEILFGSGKEVELWWWFLVGVIALLCTEVWMTRRRAKDVAARP